MALLGVIVSLNSKLPDDQSAPAQVLAPSTPEAATMSKAEPARDETAPTPRIVATDKSHTWETVESEDYQDFIENLRAIGCPEETINDIIRADMNKLFNARKAATREPFEYWRTGNFLAQLMDDKRIKAHTEMNQQKRDLMKSLLGEDAKMDSNPMAQAFNPMEAMMDFLPNEKQSQLIEKLQNWQGEAMKYVGNGNPDAKDMGDLKKLRDKIEAELM